MKFLKNVAVVALLALTVTSCFPIIGGGDDPKDPDESPKTYESRLYNEKLIRLEMESLKAEGDNSQEGQARMIQLEDGLKTLFETHSELVYLGIRPPLPCPVIEHCFPGDPELGSLRMGVYTNDPNSVASKITDANMQNVAAYGVVEKYDEKTHTAWLKFDVVNPDMVDTRLHLIITTAVEIDGQNVYFALEDTFEEGTFSRQKQ